MRRSWSQTNGYRDVLGIGLPLVVSMGSSTVMHFTDRVFLSNYSLDAIAAAMPAGISSFLFLCFFLGMAGYVNVFIAQYTGAVQPRQVAASLWQGIYFSFFASLILASLYFLAEPIFAASGHPPEVSRLEVIYFQILTLGSGFSVLGVALSCFFSGRGRTRPVMVVNLLGAGLNIPLDYALINGVWFFPEWGIAGAGLATVISWAVLAGLFALLIFRRENRLKFGLWQERAFNPELFGRLLRFGLPGGLQFFLDILSFSMFVFLVGRLGKVDLAATNIVFTINHLAFLPMVGFSIGLSTLVGQAMGRSLPIQAQEATKSCLHIAFAYMLLVALLFVLAPEMLLTLFRPRNLNPAQFAPIMASGVVLLRFVALYSLFDAFGLIYVGALKGAGDVYFLMWAIGITSLLLMVLPVYLGILYFGFGLYLSFACVTVYVAVLGFLLWGRYRRGKWRSMRVI